MADSSTIFFDWQLFLPQQSPQELLSQGVSSTAALSALFIWLIIILFGLSLLWLIVRSLLAHRQIGFLFGLVKRAQRGNIIELRRELRQLASKKPAGRLWLSFDASWVESADGQHIFMTQDASYFFNPSTLAPGISGNRLLASLPGILTAFGIIGTFVGLQIGLSTLNFNNPQNLTESIVPLIQGAAVAFSTSVWGTVASVLFNFLEKSFEQSLVRRIKSLENRANLLFRAHSAEQTLLNIEHAGQESENALKGLAEQIGERMQEVMLDMPKQIQAGIESSMAPAIDKLVDAAEKLAQKQGDSAQEALASMIEEFVSKVSASGEESRNGMEDASSKLSESIAQWSVSMEAFLKRLDQRAGTFDEQLSGLLQQGRELSTESGISREALKVTAGEMQSGGALLKQATQDLQSFAKTMQESARLLSSQHLETAKLADSAAQNQALASERLEKIAAVLEQANNGLTEASASLQSSAEVAKDSLGNMNEELKKFVEDLRKVLNGLRKQVGQMMNEYATDVEEQTKSRMDQWNVQTQEFSKNMVAAVNTMSDILSEIDNALASRRD